ncbi:MAG: cytoplasmic protein [Pseudomonadota bacterium]
MNGDSFKQLEATSLYCPQCKVAVPVRKRLLIVLPEGDKFEYLCSYCALSLGFKIEPQGKQNKLLI